MELANSGSDVFGSVRLGIKSAKTICTLLCTINDAPRLVTHTADTVAALQNALQQLSQYPPARGASINDEFQAQVEKCSKDLEKLAKALENIMPLDSDSRSRTVLKRATVMVDGKRLTRINDVVAAHSSTLVIWLQSMQRNALEHSEKRIHTLSQEVSMGFQANSTQWAALEAKVNDLHKDFTKGNSLLDSRFPVIQETSNQILDEVRDNYHEVTETCSLMFSAVQSLLSQMQIRDEQMDSIKCILKQVQSVQRQHIPRTNEFSSNSDPCPQSNAQSRILGDLELLDSINRLQRLGDQKAQVANSQEVDNIISDLKTVLQGVQDQANDSVVMKFNRIRGLFSSAQMLSINQHEAMTRLGKYVIEKEDWRAQYKVGGGTVTISTRKRRFGDYVSNPPKRNEQENSEFNSEDFVARLQFLPHKPGAMFMATIRQEVLLNGTFSPIPRFQSNNVLASDSLVFQHVKNGNLPGLVSLLQEGKASLRDHDDLGNSLIFLAATFVQPHICRFLLTNHADVDTYGYDPPEEGVNGGLSPILRFNINDFESSEEDIAFADECRRILLEAGADPTDHTDYAHSGFFYSFVGCSLQSMKIFLDLNQGFANIRSRDPWGRTPLLFACGGHQQEGLSRDIFSFLVNRGASLSDVDVHGRGCLHTFIPETGLIWGRNGSIQRELDALIYLIDNGANVWAKDDYGQSVSCLVYSLRNNDTTMGSYHRDLWDVALTVCGYDILNVRGEVHRVGWYTPQYTTLDFASLWAEWESLCPYPGDLHHAKISKPRRFASEYEYSDEDGSNMLDDDGDSEDSDDGGVELCSDDANREDVSLDTIKPKQSLVSEDDDHCVCCNGIYNTLLETVQCSHCNWTFGCQDPNCEYHVMEDHSDTSIDQDYDDE